jgi:hypothetical protein
MYETSHESPYLYIRNSAPQDWGEQRPLRDGPIGQDRRRGMPISSGIMCWCTRTQHAAQGGLGHRGGAERRVGAKQTESSDPMIEADAPNTGVLQVQIGMVCASHRG